MTDAYLPRPEHKFTFGLWTVGNPGRDPFGEPVRPVQTPVQLVRMLAEVGAYGVNFHDDDLVPIDATAAERDRIVKDFRGALDETGLKVPMATTNLFTDPAFKDGAFTATDPRVRAYALQKTMRGIDLGISFGAKVYVFWGGREGIETDSGKDAGEALRRFRDALDFLCEYVRDQKYDLVFALEAKPNEPRHDIYLPTTGAMLGFIPTLAHPEMVGVNPEVAHEHMSGLNFMHAIAQAWDAGKLFHIDLNDQAFGRYDQDLRFGSHSIKSCFFLVKFLEDVGYPGMRHFDSHAYRTEDLEGVKDFARGSMRSYLLYKEKARRWNEDADIRALRRELDTVATDSLPAGIGYGREKAEALKRHAFDRKALGARGLALERLDQLTLEVILGRPLNMGLFLGIDVSTTAAKALLMDERGGVVATAASPLTLQTPRPLWSEQDPHQWWAGTALSVRQALDQARVAGSAVSAVGLTGQMHGLVLLDESRRVLRPAILWNDQRTGAECDAIRERLGGRAALVRLTGNDALTGFTAPKILWVRAHEPEVYGQARLVLLPKDYVRLRLTGVAAMDKADGSGTLLFDVARRAWSREVLSALDIPAEWLPPTFEGPQVTGEVTAEAAAQTGLAAGTPVVAGGGDQAAGAVGVGAVHAGVVSVTLGTSGVVFASTDRPLVEPEGRLHAFCHAVPGKWHLMGVTLSAAGSLEWYRNTLAPGESFEALVQEAESAPPASEGALFLPYLSGERTPYPDPHARGAWVGLTIRHRREHLTRAVLEGVAFSLKDCFALLKESGLGAVRQVRVAGGGARSRLWRRIVASALDVELVTVNSTEGAAAGAALLAMVGVGQAPSVEGACDALIAVTDRETPDPAWVRAYADAYPRYRALYPALKPTMDDLQREVTR